MKKRATRALFWSFFDRCGDELLRFLISLILARLLLPGEFGLIAMITVVFEIAQQVVNGGFGLALINRRNHTREDECAVFWFNLLTASLLCVAIAAAAPQIALFFRERKLTMIVRIQSIGLVISSLGTIQTVLLMKTMDFKRQTVISMITTAISGSIGICMAFRGYGVWSLVIQLMARSTIAVFLLWILCSWRPSFMLSFGSLASMFGYGSKMFLSDMVNVTFGNLYTIIIGRMHSASDLAFFWRGKQLQQLPNESVWAALGRVAFPSFSLLRGDMSKFTASFDAMLELTAFLMIPAMLIMAACSENLVLFLYTEKWTGCAVYLKIFCFSGAFIIMDRLACNAVSGSGKSGHFLGITILQKTLLLASIAVSFRFGIFRMTVAYSVATLLCFIIDYVIYCALFSQSAVKGLLRLTPYAVFGVASYFTCMIAGVLRLPLPVLLALQTTSGAFVYLVFNFLANTRGISETSDLLRPMIGRTGTMVKGFPYGADQFRFRSRDDL